ncbi:hypothetical protein V501_03534 [Pseudogymnoascus sp. VKM F-4519 (FW-2642)]|nr:hypothetical protein V501_03534 [Pseudogymnoascus sp. VKM F-4519 (FW-2642)]
MDLNDPKVEATAYVSGTVDGTALQQLMLDEITLSTNRAGDIETIRAVSNDRINQQFANSNSLEDGLDASRLFEVPGCNINYEIDLAAFDLLQPVVNVADFDFLSESMNTV